MYAYVLNTPSPLLQCVYSIYKQPVLCELGSLLEQGALPEVSTLVGLLILQ